MSGAPRGSLVDLLTRRLLIAAGTLWVACSLGVAWHVRNELQEGFDSALLESAYKLLDLIDHELAEKEQHPEMAMNLRMAAQKELAARQLAQSFLIFQLVDVNNRVLRRSLDAPLEGIPVPLVSGYADTATLRVFTLKHPLEPYFIHVADPLAHRQRGVWEGVLWLMVPLLGLLPLLAWVVGRVTRDSLRPVAQVAEQIGQRHGEDLRPVASEGLPTELQAITASTNHLLQRLAGALDTERALAANAAHELRTPLATVRLRLQAALQAAPTSEGAAPLREALAALSQLSRRAEKLLQLSRAESGAAFTQAPVNLAAVAGAVAQEFWIDASLRQRLQLAVPEDHDVIVLGDFDAIAIALRNLVENAVRYAPTGPITVTVEAPGGLRVRDHGPGVPSERLASLMQRHVRNAPDAAGFGLGLSIVSSIARRHHAKFALLPAAPGKPQGLEARLDFLSVSFHPAEAAESPTSVTSSSQP